MNRERDLERNLSSWLERDSAGLVADFRGRNASALVDRLELVDLPVWARLVSAALDRALNGTLYETATKIATQRSPNWRWRIAMRRISYRP